MANDERPNPEKTQASLPRPPGEPETMEEYIDGIRRRAEHFEREGKGMIASAERSKRLAKLARKQLRFEECRFVFGLKGKQAEKMERIREKIDPRVEPAQVIDAALTHLEWKVDREAEGLRIQAGEPVEDEDGDGWEEDEPWQP